MNIAALYIRVSTEEQTDYSPDAQKRLLLNYAKTNDYHVPEEFIFIDEGISGRRADKRPAFMQMIRMAKKKPHPFDAILVHKFDRFSRSREDSILYKSILKRECGIRVISITEHLEDDKFSIILEAILEAMAEYYSLNLSDEVLKGMTEKAIRGGYQAAPPLGYYIPHAKEIPRISQEEATLVRQIFHRFVIDHRSPYEIARELNAYGYRTKRGNPFEKRTISYILSNPFYAGYIRFQLKKAPSSAILTQGVHEPLITKELYDAAAKMQDLTKQEPRKHAPGSKHWLSGLVKCSNCGSSLLVYKRVLERRGKTYYNLQCCGYQKGRCLQSHQLSLQKMLSTLHDSLLEVYPQTSMFYQLSMHTIHTHSKNLPSTEDLIHKLSTRLQRAKDAYLNGIDTLADYSQTKKELTKQMEQLRKEPKETLAYTNEPEKTPSFPSLASLLLSEQVLDSDKRQILTTLLHHMEYDKETATIRFYYYLPFCNKDDPMGL
nr:recombinase family protein [Anaerosporobacter faecicola]